MLLVGGGDEGVGRCLRKRRRIRLSKHCPQKARSFIRTFEDNVMESGTAAHAFTPRAASVETWDGTDMPPGNTGAFAPASAVLTEVSRIHDAGGNSEEPLEGRDLPKHGSAGVLEQSWHAYSVAKRDETTRELGTGIAELDLGFVTIGEVRKSPDVRCAADGPPRTTFGAMASTGKG